MSRLTGRAVMRLRASWQQRIDRGTLVLSLMPFPQPVDPDQLRNHGIVVCPKCNQPVRTGQEWDLGHQLAHALGGSADDVVPEHRGPCNRADGGRLGAALRRRPRRRFDQWTGGAR